MQVYYMPLSSFQMSEQTLNSITQQLDIEKNLLPPDIYRNDKHITQSATPTLWFSSNFQLLCSVKEIN